MVETRERETVYTTEEDAGPSTLLMVLFSLLIVALLGFLVYFFSNTNLKNNPAQIIEHNTQTTVPTPIPPPSTPTLLNPNPSGTESGGTGNNDQ